jgi:predicted lipid-binding transport protein (Tim44 family)
MSPQIIEIIIFASIALFLINKLLSILGTTDEDDPVKSFKFNNKNESSQIKDVTNTINNENEEESAKEESIKNLKTKYPYLQDDLLQNLDKILNFDFGFDDEKFLKSTNIVARELIKAYKEKDQKIIDSLVDTRFLSAFNYIMESNPYKECNLEKITSLYSDIYIFGNNISITVEMTFSNNKKENWVFSHSILQDNKDWYLSNIDNS